MAGNGYHTRRHDSIRIMATPLENPDSADVAGEETMFSCMVQTNLPDGSAATDKVIDTGTEELYGAGYVVSHSWIGSAMNTVSGRYGAFLTKLFMSNKSF